MNEDTQYVVNTIKGWVWSGFYDIGEVEEMVEDIIEGDCDLKLISQSIIKEFESKKEAEKFWPAETDFDKLYDAFMKMHEEGICALHNAGYTMSDGFSDVTEFLHCNSHVNYHGFCFYHGQDVERAVEGGGLMLAFGDLKDVAEDGIKVGKKIVKILRNYGFNVHWDESLENRIGISGLDWKHKTGKYDY